MDATARWWDGIELWVTGLPFIPQALVVLVVVVPIAFGLSIAFDRVLALVLHGLGRDRRRIESPDSTDTGSAETAVEVKEGK